MKVSMARHALARRACAAAVALAASGGRTRRQVSLAVLALIVLLRIGVLAVKRLIAG